MVQIRAFIAIELSTAAANRLTTLQQRLKAVVPANTVRWTPVENIHLTLHFLGNVGAPDVEKVTVVLREAALTCFPLALTLDGLGCFPNTRQPNIVWVGVTGEVETLAALQRNLGQKLNQAIGFVPDARPYSPHLTIGRVKKEMPSRLLTQMGQAIEQERPAVGQLAALAVTQISLIKSDLQPAGPVYTVLAHALLDGFVAN